MRDKRRAVIYALLFLFLSIYSLDRAMIVTGYLVAMTADFKVALVLCGGLSFIAAALVTALTHRPLGERIPAPAAV